MSSKNEVIKKKKIIIILLAVIITLLIIIGVIGGLLIYKNSQKDKDNFSGDVNILDIGNNVQEEEQNILNVELEGEEPINQVNNQDENSENNNTETTTKPKPVDAPYYIKVNYGANTVTVYKKDKHGKYNNPIKAFICSVGTSTPTSGVYSISDKYTWRLLVRKCIWTIRM
ncbi:MAG: L,D-transpeptidase [Clostridia bacterium]|nr:L,D-transpeptidase [Clostridia bacterium]